MDKTENNDKWVFTIVEHAGNNENFVGYEDKKKNINFIPVFKEKEQASACFINMPREAGNRYEIQAVLYDEVLSYAAKSNFMIFLLDKDGKVLEEITPSAKNSQ